MDIFNPNHYLPRLFREEPPLSPVIIDEQHIIFSRNHIFKNFNVKLLNNPENEGKASLYYTNNENNMMIVTSNHLHTINYINNGKLILENISLNRSNTVQHIHVSGECELYLLTHNLSEQLSYISMNIFLEKNAKLKVFSLNNKHNQKSKYAFTYSLNSNAEIDIQTLSMIAQNQYQDDSIQVIHSIDSKSNITYRSLTEGFTVSQVNSIIPQNASKASTQQHLKHTMLNEHAKVFSKPNLEISNSDVSASHGNSIGTFNDEHLFYLQQRGLTHEKSIALLLQSELDNFLFKTSLQQELQNYINTMEK